MKAYTSLIFLLLGALNLSAQDISLRIGGGYGLPASGDDYGVSQIDGGAFSSENAIYGSNGAGARGFVEIGYRLQEYLTIQLGGAYLRGKQQTRLRQLFFNQGPAFSGQNINISEYSKQIRLQPSLVLGTHNRKLNPFLQVGLSLPVWTMTIVEAEYEELGNMPSIFTNQLSEIRGKPLLGFSAGMGLSWIVNPHVGFTVALEAVSQRMKAASGRLTQYEVSGVDQLAGLDLYEREWRYLEQLTSNDNAFGLNPDADNDSPEDRLQISQNFSSYQLKVGVELYWSGGQ